MVLGELDGERPAREAVAVAGRTSIEWVILTLAPTPRANDFRSLPALSTVKSASECPRTRTVSAGLSLLAKVASRSTERCLVPCVNVAIEDWTLSVPGALVRLQEPPMVGPV